MGEHRRSEVQTGGRPLPRPVPFRPRLIPRSHTEKCVSRFISETADDGALQGRSEPGTRATVCEAESQAKTGSRFQISANTQLTSSVSVDAVLAHPRCCHEHKRPSHWSSSRALNTLVELGHPPLSRIWHSCPDFLVHSRGIGGSLLVRSLNGAPQALITHS